MNDFLSVAKQAAEAAAQVIKHYYAEGAKVTIKADYTPVTQADVESEQAIHKVIADHFPKHGFYGEETGKSQMDADYIWLIDPIDGTKSFVRRYPFFSTQIALMYKGEIIMGVSSAPMWDELAWASKGGGAFLNGEAIHISDLLEWRDIAVSTGNIASLTRTPAWQSLGELLGQVGRTRGYGDFYHYHLLAAGKIDAVVESDVNILDIAALSIIVNEAGGCFTELDGSAINLDTRTVLAANPKLHARMLAKLNEHVNP